MMRGALFEGILVNKLLILLASLIILIEVSFAKSFATEIDFLPLIIKRLLTVALVRVRPVPDHHVLDHPDPHHPVLRLLHQHLHQLLHPHHVQMRTPDQQSMVC